VEAPTGRQGEYGKMTELQSRTTTHQHALDGGKVEEATVEVAEQTRQAVVGTAEAAAEEARHVPVPGVDLLQMWTSMVVGIPFTLLTGDRGAVLSGKAWVDGAFETAQTVSGAQRKYVDDVLAIQHRVVGQFVDSSWTLATMGWKAGQPTAPHGPVGG
jgi:hypothetical protein